MTETDYEHCPHCGGYIFGLSPQKKEWLVALRVGCGRPWCKVEDDHIGNQKTLPITFS